MKVARLHKMVVVVLAVVVVVVIIVKLDSRMVVVRFLDFKTFGGSRTFRSPRYIQIILALQVDC